MIMNREEQLNEFFENGMSAADEQNFLISVAASDELRRAFRSQLELMKAVRSDKDSLRSVAQVRNRTLAALGLSATAAGQFFEQELLNGEKAAGHKPMAAYDRSSAEPLVANAPRIGMQWAGQWAGRLLHTPALTLSAGLLFGIFSTTAIEHFEHVPSAPAVPAPAVLPMPAVSPAGTRSGTAETIPAKNGLNSIGARSSGNTMAEDRPASSHAEPVAYHRASMEHHAANTPRVANPVANTVQSNPSLPEISRNNPGVMQSQKAKITQKNDSTKATP